MIKLRSDEEWKPLQFNGSQFLRRKYALSSRDRITSYTNKILENGKIRAGSLTRAILPLIYIFQVA
jgi:hypothetical protein